VRHFAPPDFSRIGRARGSFSLASNRVSPRQNRDMRPRRLLSESVADQQF